MPNYRVCYEIETDDPDDALDPDDPKMRHSMRVTLLDEPEPDDA
jgi:hypothetical protein